MAGNPDLRLFGHVSLPPVQTVALRNREQFDALFEGFTRLRGVAYVSSPAVLLRLFDRGYRQIELVVGDGLSGHKNALGDEEANVLGRLTDLAESGSLLLLKPNRHVDHSKLFVLSDRDDGVVRVINGSVNLTETGRQGRQWNHVWVVDLPGDHPDVRRHLEAYQEHTKSTESVFADLVSLMKDRRDDESRLDVVRRWLAAEGHAPAEDRIEVRAVYKDATAGAIAVLLEPEGDGTEQERVERIFELRLPDNPKVRREVEANLGVESVRHLDPEGKVLALDAARFVTRYQEVQGYPLLEVDLARRRVILAIDGEARQVNRAFPDDPAPVVDGLAHVEAYIESVERSEAKAPDPQYAMTSMYEALLYFLAAPFAHERMKIMRTAFGPAKSKGPKSLYVYGATNNGKSSLARFGLKLLAGRHLVPLTDDDYKKDKLLAAAMLTGTFPAVFDDVSSLSKHSSIAPVFKGYWEASWREACPQPALVFTCNKPSVPDWAKSRVHRLDFDVVFNDNAANSVRLGDLMDQDNAIFEFFAEEYLGRLLEMGPGIARRDRDVLGKLDDDLSLAREAMAALYQKAARPLPSYFPNRPVHETYNPEPKRLAEMIRYGKVLEKWDGETLLLEFAEDLEDQDVKEFLGYLPQQAKTRRRGRTLIVEGVQEYRGWLAKGTTRAWWDRLWGWFSG